MSVYCLDTSAFLDGWVRYYPPDVFPALWKKLEAAIIRGDVISPEEVGDELSKKHDGVFQWTKAQSGLFVPMDDPTQDMTSKVLAKFPRLVKALSGRNRADPFVIALAKVRKGTVATAERARGSPERPRIPLVCDFFNIPCVNLLDMIRAMGWKFQ